MYDSFFDCHQDFTLQAQDIDHALDLAHAIADGNECEIEEIKDAANADGERVYLSPNQYDIVHDTVCFNDEGTATTDTIPALTYDMALDLAELIYPPGKVI